MIRDREIRVIDDEKKQLGVMSASDALALARQRGLDLVEIAPQAQPAGLPDHGLRQVPVRAAQEGSRSQEAPEAGPDQGDQVPAEDLVHDYDFKLKHVQRFLEEGNKVKITIMLRGREKSRPEMGQQVLDRVVEDCDGLGKLDGEVRKMDWAVSALLVPAKAGGKDAKAKNPPGSQQEVPGNGETKRSSTRRPIKATS